MFDFQFNHDRVVRRFTRQYPDGKKPDSRAGFSLVETMVIMIVIGVITAIMLPLTTDMFLAMSEKKKARQLASILGQARNMAVGHNAEVIIEFDIEKNHYTGFIISRASGKAEKVLKIDETSIDLIGLRSATGALETKGIVGIRFLPSGTTEQTYIYVGTDQDNPESIVVLDRYLGTARSFKSEQEVNEYQTNQLKDDLWKHDPN